MTRATALEDISQALGLLTHQTKAENLAGYFSKNRITEDLLLPLFRILLDAPRLRNLNNGVQSFPHIDLADDQAGVAVRVTTDRNSPKVTKTLEGFLGRGLHQQYHRLLVFVLTDHRLKHTQATKQKWQRLCDTRLSFDPSRDVLTTPQLLALTATRSPAEIFAIRDIFDQSIVGKQFIDVPRLLHEQAAEQLDAELGATKYIPDVFVETRETKYLARCFAHPTLFLQRIVEETSRLSLDRFSQQAEEMGLQPVAASFPQSSTDSALAADAVSTATAMRDTLEALKAELEPYERLPRDQQAPLLRPERRHVFEARKWNIEHWAYGLRRRLDSRLEELAACTARIFVLTGKAGQGKTNFVCDFLQRFLWKHDIPCALISGRRLRAMRGTDLAEIMAHVLFRGAARSFDDAAQRLSSHANRRAAPFVLLIDGLNEHLDPDFAVQLEQFLRACLRYPDLRILVTCRSEFFDVRFGRLFKEALTGQTIIVESGTPHERKLQHDALLRAYFDFFDVRPDLVALRVADALVEDMLLLRFFCEAYGARGKGEDYRQPHIAHIYRDQIFEIYLRKKLDAGAALLQAQRGQVVAMDPKAQLEGVLCHVVRHMVGTDRVHG